MERRTAINAILLAAFIIIAGFLFIASSTAATYNQFCRDNDYNVAGNVRNYLICIRVNDNNIEYRKFKCEYGCAFTEEETVLLPGYDLNIGGITNGDFNLQA